MDRKVEQFILFRIRAFADQKAFASLVNEYGSKLDKFLRFRLPRNEDAQDAYSEIWMNLWTYAQRTEIESVSGLIFTMARNAIATFYEKKSHRPEFLAGDNEFLLNVGTQLHQEMIEKVDVELLKNLMSQLSDEDAEVILLRYVEGQQVKEIAKMLGKTENATSVSLHRAISRLRTLIQKKFEDTPI